MATRCFIIGFGDAGKGVNGRAENLGVNIGIIEGISSFGEWIVDIESTVWMEGMGEEQKVKECLDVDGDVFDIDWRFFDIDDGMDGNLHLYDVNIFASDPQSLDLELLNIVGVTNLQRSITSDNPSFCSKHLSAVDRY
ncbi:hypothetical protein NDU88_001133 [Pleurodeles waltl]|uniref:Uncharacterized protein n=1 Tax=Pleurodeles waltl TaxID=8319 RepID=A0AAV7SC45_PLEWA|nr:hypothetical protein NDU88_001133 [Pleurodeles waltl]